MYPARSMTIRTPSPRESRSSPNSQSSKVAAASRTAVSRMTRLRVVGMTVNSAQPPRMKPRLKMFEPTTFPTEMSGCPFSAATSVTTISGAEVPSATTVEPISASETSSRRAMRQAETTVHSAPFQSSAVATSRSPRLISACALIPCATRASSRVVSRARNGSARARSASDPARPSAPEPRAARVARVTGFERLEVRHSPRG